MATSSIPVDLRNPGQVFACVGFMEAAEVLCGVTEACFSSAPGSTQATFVLTVCGLAKPVREVLGFLARASAVAVCPADSELSTEKWSLPLRPAVQPIFPMPAPDKPAMLPALLSDPLGHTIPIEYWCDTASVGRDNVKLWAGAGGLPGAALARDALALIADLRGDSLDAAETDPFSVQRPQSSSFRFDWRRDYVPLDAGFSPNQHQDAIKMIGYPIVELLAAIGLQNARPERPDWRDKLSYRYGVSSAILPIELVRAVLGAQAVGFSVRTFRMRLGWPGQEGQARCILDAQEEN